MHLQRRRPGTTLVYFALFSLVMLGLLGLVVDLGLAMLTQKQMQVAADAAALEGLRGYDASDPATDSTGRQSAQDVVRWIFDDDFDPDNGSIHRFGAGPDFNVVFPNPGGLTVQIQPSGFYRPTPQLNPDDEPHGDMVRNYFHQTEDGSEDQDYQRADFTDTPNASAQKAFLVRLRRTKTQTGAATNPLDEQADVSSSGNSLPLLFSRAAMIPHDHPLRTRGIPVRATAIAEGHPAVTVGVVDTANNVTGVMPFAVSMQEWNTLQIGVATKRPAFRLAEEGPVAVGHFVTEDTPQPLEDSNNQRYLPIYETFNEGKRVIGFGYARAMVDESGEVTITKENPIVARKNASAVLTIPLSSPVGINEVFAKRGLIVDPLRAAALVR